MPVGAHWHACEDGADDRHQAPNDAYAHDNIEWYAQLTHCKYASVLQQDGNLGQGKTGVVADDTRKEKLLIISRAACQSEVAVITPSVSGRLPLDNRQTCYVCHCQLLLLRWINQNTRRRKPSSR